MDSRELPSTENKLRRVAPIIAKRPAAAEWQLVNITRNETVLNVELCRPAILFQIQTVLRLSKGSSIKARSSTARGDVIGSFGQRLTPRVSQRTGQTLREALLQSSL